MDERESLVKKGSLLEHILDRMGDPSLYLDAVDDLKEWNTTLADYKLHPEVYNEEEISFSEIDIEDDNNRILEMESGWNSSGKNMSEEIQLIRVYVEKSEEIHLNNN